MATSLLETLGTYITPDIVTKASALLGESSGGTQKALTGILPTLLGGATSMASTEGGASKLMGLLQSGGYDGGMLNNVGSLLSGGTQTQNLLGTGQQLLGSLLGDKTSAVTSSISNFSGIKTSSAASLLAMAAPLVMSLLGKTQATQGLSASGLAGVLTS